MRRLFAGAAFAVAIGLAGAADTAAPIPAPGSPQALVEQLGSERYSDREAAGAALEKLGPAALPALQAATRSENPEVRERAAALIGRLKRASESTARLTPKRVKLDYKDLPLGTAIHDLKTRTGLPLVLDATRVADPLRKVTCQTAEVPVWEALEAFCTAAELRELFVNELDVPKPARPAPRGAYTPPPPPPNADAVPIVLADGKPDRLPGDRSTAVRVVALPKFAGHKVTLGTGELTLCLDVTPTPGLNWLDTVGVKVTRVIDSAGRTGSAGAEKLPVQINDPTGNVVWGGPGIAMRFDPHTGQPIAPETTPNPRVLSVPLKVATPSARSLKRLEGAVYAEVNLTNQHLITVTDLAKNSGKGHTGPGDTKFTVLEVKEAAAGPGGTGILRVQLEYPPPWVTNARRRGWNPGFNFGWPEPPQHPSLSKTVQAFDAAGKPVTLTGGSNYTDIGGDGMTHVQTLEYRFRAGVGVPAKLVVVGPKTVLVEIPFVMENVQLP